MIEIRLQEKKGNKMVEVIGKLPESWDELTIGQYLDFKTVDVNDAGRFLEIFTGVPKEVFYNAPATEVNEKLLGKLAWLSKTQAELDGLEIPYAVTILGQEFRIPRNLEQESWGQQMLMEQLMERHSADLSFAIPRAIAIYVQPKMNGGKFDLERVDEVEMMVRKSTPLKNAWAVGCFFFKKRIASIKSGQNN